jgi:hypothetical protein
MLLAPQKVVSQVINQAMVFLTIKIWNTCVKTFHKYIGRVQKYNNTILKVAKFRNHVSIALSSKKLASILSKDTPKLSQNLHLYNKIKYVR